MEIKDVLKCSFQNWYDGFKEITPRSIILPLPDGFIDYLLADGIVLPNNECEESCRTNNASTSSDDEDDDDENWETCDNTVPEAPKFEEFDQKIRDAVEELGGKVFPKLNWSSPRDATWIALNNSCCCTTVNDIYLLLKSSDFITHDITQPFLRCVDYDSDVSETNSVDNKFTPYYLVLREWLEINPDTEFRCFVKDSTLIGITQRDASMYSDYNVTQKDKIVRDIVSFFVEHIQCGFDSEDYVFDVVVKKQGNVYLLDFNPFGEVTDPILFDWSELTNGKLLIGNASLPEYRCVDHNRGIQPRPFSYYSIPKDIVDISTGEDTAKFIDLLKLHLYQKKMTKVCQNK